MRTLAQRMALPVSGAGERRAVAGARRVRRLLRRRRGARERHEARARVECVGHDRAARRTADDRRARRRGRRRARERQLRPAGPRRPRRRPRRKPPGREPAGREAHGSSRRSHARRDRRRCRRSCGRASRVCSTEAGVDVVGEAGDAGAAARARRDAPAGRRDHRHPDATEPHRRGPRRRPDDPSSHTRDRGARPLAVRRRRVRASARRRRADPLRLPPEGPRPRRAGARLGRPAGGRRGRRRSTPGSSTSCSRAGGRQVRSTSSPSGEREVLGLMAEGLTDRGIAEPPLAHPADGRDARPAHPAEARDPRGRGRQPEGARGARLPARLTAIAVVLLSHV